MKNNCQCGELKDTRSLLCRKCRYAESDIKVCNGCNKPYPIGEYHFRPNGRGGHKRRSRCKWCEGEYEKQRRKDHPEKIRTTKRAYEAKHPDKVRSWSKRARWKSWGFDPDAIEAFFAQQPQACAICGATDTLRVDHCHQTMRLRGALCSTCNSGLGFFKDSPDLLMKAALYLL